MRYFILICINNNIRINFIDYSYIFVYNTQFPFGIYPQGLLLLPQYPLKNIQNPCNFYALFGCILLRAVLIYL